MAQDALNNHFRHSQAAQIATEATSGRPAVPFRDLRIALVIVSVLRLVFHFAEVAHFATVQCWKPNYDPVCFDMKRRNRADAPIVQLDHEEILERGRIRVVREIAPSFAQFMQSASTEKPP